MRNFPTNSYACTQGKKPVNWSWSFWCSSLEPWLKLRQAPPARIAQSVMPAPPPVLQPGPTFAAPWPALSTPRSRRMSSLPASTEMRYIWLNNGKNNNDRSPKNDVVWSLNRIESSQENPRTKKKEEEGIVIRKEAYIFLGTPSFCGRYFNHASTTRQLQTHYYRSLFIFILFFSSTHFLSCHPIKNRTPLFSSSAVLFAVR